MIKPCKTVSRHIAPVWRCFLLYSEVAALLNGGLPAMVLCKVGHPLPSVALHRASTSKSAQHVVTSEYEDASVRCRKHWAFTMHVVTPSAVCIVSVVVPTAKSHRNLPEDPSKLGCVATPPNHSASTREIMQMQQAFPVSLPQEGLVPRALCNKL